MEDLLMDAGHEFKSGILYFVFDNQSAIIDRAKCKNCTLKELALREEIKKNPSITQKELDSILGKFERTVNVYRDLVRGRNRALPLGIGRFFFSIEWNNIRLSMKEVRIKVIKKSFFKELSVEYEKEVGECCVSEGDGWVSKDALMPEGFCQSAWSNLQPYVFALSSGGGGFFGEWMKNPHSAVISCNDGIRPVSFLLETIE